MEFASNTTEPVLHCSAGAQLEPDPSRPVLEERVSLKANPGTSRKETKHNSNDEKKSWPTSTWGQNFEASSKTHNAVSDDQQANKRLDVPASAAATSVRLCAQTRQLRSNNFCCVQDPPCLRNCVHAQAHKRVRRLWWCCKIIDAHKGQFSHEA